MANVVELLSLILDKVTPSKDLDEAQWTNLVSKVKSTLFQSKDFITNSPDPLIEGLSTVLNTLVANKCAPPGSSLYNALLLSRCVSPTTPNDFNQSTPNSRLGAYDETPSQAQRRSVSYSNEAKTNGSSKRHKNSLSESERARAGKGSQSPIMLMLKRMIRKRPSQEEQPDEVIDVDAEDYNHTSRRAVSEPQLFSDRSRIMMKSQGHSRKRSLPTSDPDSQTYHREPYPLRSGHPKGGTVLTPHYTPPPRKQTSSIEVSARVPVPPLDLGSIRPHDHLTTPGSTASAPDQLHTPQAPHLSAAPERQHSQRDLEYRTVLTNRDLDPPKSYSNKTPKPIQPPHHHAAHLSTPPPPIRKAAETSTDKSKEHSKPSEPGLLMVPNSQVDGSPGSEIRYTGLKEISGDMNNINLYLVAVEMIRATVRNLNTQKDVYNYRAIDPTLHIDGVDDFTLPDMDYSIQIVMSNATKQHHINFGDILRVKRVDAFLREDKLGKKHINILMTKKNFPSMRLWHCARYDQNGTYELATERVDIDFNKLTESARAKGGTGTPRSTDPNSPGVNHEGLNGTLNGDAENGEGEDNDPAYKQEAEKMHKSAINVYGGQKITFDHTDYVILSYLKDWALKMDPMAFFSKSEFLRKLADANEASSDFIVKVLVVNHGDYSLMVGDSSARALVRNFDPLLVTNLFDSSNPVRAGDWLKLRSFTRIFNDRDSLVCIGGTTYSCVTRLPAIPDRVVGDEELVEQTNRKKVTLDVWSASSYLNNSFPKRFKRSPGFIHKVLYGHPVAPFQKASPRRSPAEREEGEISQ